MDLDSLVNAIVSQQFIYICLAVYVVTYFVRRLIEGTWKVLVETGRVRQTTLAFRLWNEVCLPVLTIFVGGLMGLMAKTFVWPELTNGTRSGRIMFGAVCGLFSAFIYNRIRAWIKSNPAKAEEDNGLPPVATEPPPADETRPTLVVAEGKKDKS